MRLSFALKSVLGMLIAIVGSMCGVLRRKLIESRLRRVDDFGESRRQRCRCIIKRNNTLEVKIHYEVSFQMTFTRLTAPARLLTAKLLAYLRRKCQRSGNYSSHHSTLTPFGIPGHTLSQHF
jgi:hypothetical protein